jgi:ribosomal-protein-alanine N-acetyltransferase
MISFRAATAADLDAIDEIEQHSFKTPWPRETFAGELTREWAHLELAIVDDAIRAFANFWLVAGEQTILAIATHPDHRGRGIARDLLAHVLAAARAASCHLSTLEVRRSNAPAIALYERAGFRTVHTRFGYYQDGEDALVMTLAL